MPIFCMWHFFFRKKQLWKTLGLGGDGGKSFSKSSFFLTFKALSILLLLLLIVLSYYVILNVDTIFFIYFLFLYWKNHQFFSVTRPIHNGIRIGNGKRKCQFRNNLVVHAAKDSKRNYIWSTFPMHCWALKKEISSPKLFHIFVPDTYSVEPFRQKHWWWCSKKYTNCRHFLKNF